VILQKLFGRGPARVAGEKLYHAAITQARQPAFYTDLGAPDTVEGRFELYTLHVVLVLNRLRGLGGEAGEASQALFDTYVQALDDALREMGVGDLSVGKKMRKLGEAFYGRAKAYQAALADGDQAAITALIGRTVYEGETAGAADQLADYVQRSAALLATLPQEDVLAAQLVWPEIVP
jgi:cytochrome b pre-mRNA-processing protein 3